MQTTQTQFVAAISESCKTWFKETSAKNLAPLKSGGVKGASEREIGDAIVAFIEETREEDGFDMFEPYLKAETAKRLTHTATRTNRQAERIAELEAMLAKLSGDA
jgi:hypothetical protein